MQGEFRGDFSRDSYDRSKRFSRVLMQQGRVQLDADWNEQNDILLHYLRSLAADPAVVEFLVDRGWSMNGRSAPVTALAKVVAQRREQLRKKEPGEAKQIG